jgi:DNA polymerase III alpha subunit (gram-positive type)
MNKFDKFVMLDTETANTIDCPFCYNVAWAVIDLHGNVYYRGNFINRDIFFHMPDLMKSAYYAEKIPQYIEQIERGEITVASWYEIRMELLRVCEEFGVRAIIAHNARFDYRSCTMTQRYETSSKYRYFFPKGVEIWDTLAMSRDVIVSKANYKKFCAENGYICKNGQPRATAEILYRYISGEQGFEEAHRAMEDVEIEMEIFWYCVRQHKAMRRKAFKG